MQEEYITNSPSQTQKVGEVLAKKFIKDISRKKATLVIGLIGDLGGGKTTFLQGFARGLGVKKKILSPTFVIMKKFKIRVNSCKFAKLYHIDCYRIQKPKEILDLGFRKLISNPKNIIVIEWADRIKKILPQDTPLIKFEFIDEKTRKITIKKRL